MKRLVLLVVAFPSLSAAAMKSSDAEAPIQAQLNGLLSGNTVQGEWDSRPFTQHFATSGSTLYCESDGPQSLGTWRVNPTGQYC